MKDEQNEGGNLAGGQGGGKKLKTIITRKGQIIPVGN